MRRPKPSDFDPGNGDGIDYKEYEDMMSQYEDSERDRQIEEECERKDEQERMADHSDQRKTND